MDRVPSAAVLNSLSLVQLFYSNYIIEVFSPAVEYYSFLSVSMSCTHTQTHTALLVWVPSHTKPEKKERTEEIELYRM